MEKMRNREDILKELEGVKADAAREAQFGNPAQLAMQAGINAPLIATALGSLLEVALDIRDQVRRCETSLVAISEQIDDAAGLVTVDKGEEPPEGVPVIRISNEERIAELLAQGKLKGFEEKCSNCGSLMKVIKQDEKAVEWTCPKCKRQGQSVSEQPK